MAEASLDLRREVNVNIARAAAMFTTGGSFEFLCECGEPECGQLVPLTLADFMGLSGPLLAPAHLH